MYSPETQFIVGRTYTARSVCDHNTVWAWTVVKRTAKFITVVEHGANEKPKRIGVRTFEGEEYALPLGDYSMAPSIYAGRLAWEVSA